MRESIGGAWLFGIVIVFIFMFAGFLAYSVSYAKAFSTKNKIISLIEEDEKYIVFNDTNGNDILNADETELSKNTEGKIYKYMSDIGYNFTANINCENDEVAKQGYCIKSFCSTNSAYYRVRTFMVFEIPVIAVPVRIPITGETRPINSRLNSTECNAYF